MTVLCHIALCVEKRERKNRSENQEVQVNILKAAQQWVLTEVQKEQQQQVGGSGVHPEWWWFTAVRLKYRRMRRRRPEGQSEGHGRDIGRERWSVWRANSWCRGGGGAGRGCVPHFIRLHTSYADTQTRKWLLLPQESATHSVLISVCRRDLKKPSDPANLLSSPSAWRLFLT